MDYFMQLAHDLNVVQVPLIVWTQHNLKFLEPLLVSLSEYFSPAKLINVVVPLMGMVNQALLVRLLCPLALLSVTASMLKWIFQSSRPYWFVRENEIDVGDAEILQFPASCENSTGFPSGHSIAFTAFLHIFISHIMKSKEKNMRTRSLTINILVLLGSIPMWISRLYLGSQFLHHSILGSVIAMLMLNFFDSHAARLGELNIKSSVVVVIIIGLLAGYIYIEKLHLGLDPLWAVRRAFMWCFDPRRLRHETGNIFMLARDIGLLSGVALSAPINSKSRGLAGLTKRITLISVIECLNYMATTATPKASGRFIFVAYEFMRNLCHAFVLLNISRLK